VARSLGAELRVLHVVPSGLSIDEAEPGLGRRLESLLGNGRAPAWSLRVRVGEAREHIVREANCGRYGLVVLSAHRRPFSSDVVIGSTVERLLRHSLIPVLACPSGRPCPAL
jgi:nucleotide-binding universal stress UspA family protein